MTCLFYFLQRGSGCDSLGRTRGIHPILGTESLTLFLLHDPNPETGAMVISRVLLETKKRTMDAHNGAS